MHTCRRFFRSSPVALNPGFRSSRFVPLFAKKKEALVVLLLLLFGVMSCVLAQTTVVVVELEITNAEAGPYVLIAGASQFIAIYQEKKNTSNNNIMISRCDHTSCTLPLDKNNLTHPHSPNFLEAIQRGGNSLYLALFDDNSSYHVFKVRNNSSIPFMTFLNASTFTMTYNDAHDKILSVWHLKDSPSTVYYQACNFSTECTPDSAFDISTHFPTVAHHPQA